MHAHRRDSRSRDEPPSRGCSSKLAAGPLIAHNRYALTDNRNWGNGNPQIVYGAIYEWWERDPNAHPTFAGNAGLGAAYPEPGHYPDDRIYAQGYGTYPPGHPGNTIGLQPPPAGNNVGGGGNNTTLVRRPASSASSSTASSGSHSRNSSNTSTSSGGGAAGKRAAPPRPKPWVFMAASGKVYDNIPLVAPYARVPAASAAAVAWATKEANALNVKANAGFLKDFSAAWSAFVGAWGRHLSRSPFCDDASVCKQTREFSALLALGPESKARKAVKVLVVHRLATEPKNFVGVYVYNWLERDDDYVVHRRDLFNYNVLQRHANLIVEMNAGRKWA